MISGFQSRKAALNAETLEIALKTVLHKNKERIALVSSAHNPRYLDELAHEIACQALVYQRITENIEQQIDQPFHLHAEQF